MQAAFDAREKTYQRNIACVLSILGQMVSTSFMYLITASDVMNLRQAWTALHGHFERPSLSNKMALKSQLFGFQMKPGNSIKSHLQELTSLIERLAALDDPVSEQDQVVLLLRSLPASFEGLVTAYMPKGEVRMAELHEVLITHEACLTGPSGAHSASGTSSAVFSGFSRQNMKRGSHGCYRCGQMGHFHRDCPKDPYVPPHSRGGPKSSFQGQYQNRGRGWG